MELYKVVISDEGKQDLNGIAHYIAVDLQEPVTALNQIKRIRAEVFTLESMPERYGLVQDEYLAVQGIRKISVDNYLVFYTVSRSEKSVNIVRVLYSRRDWCNII